MNDSDVALRLEALFADAPTVTAPARLRAAIERDRALAPVALDRVGGGARSARRNPIAALAALAACFALVAAGVAFVVYRTNVPAATPSASPLGAPVRGIQWRTTGAMPALLPDTGSRSPIPMLAALDGKFFIFGDGVWSSRDGATWTQLAAGDAFGFAAAEPTAGTAAARLQWTGAADDGQGRLFAVAGYVCATGPGSSESNSTCSSDSQIWSSTDGSHWASTTFKDTRIFSIASQGRTIVAAGETSAATPVAVAWYWDGGSWQRADVEDGNARAISQVVATADGFLAVGGSRVVTDSTGHAVNMSSPDANGRLSTTAWRSADGKSWRKAGSLPFAVAIPIVALRDRLVTFDEELIPHSSRDGGVTWQTAELPTKDGSAIALVRVNGSVVALGSSSSGPTAWVSEDGATWKSLSVPTNAWLGQAQVAATGGTVVVAAWNDGAIYVGNASATALSTGTSPAVAFQEAAAPPTYSATIEYPVESAWVNGHFYVVINGSTAGTPMAATSSGGPQVWSSGNGNAWNLIADARQFSDPNLPDAAVVDWIGDDGRGGLVAAGTLSPQTAGIWLSPDGRTWRRASIDRTDVGAVTGIAADGGVMVATAADGGVMVATAADGSVLRSTDGGSAWRRVALPSGGELLAVAASRQGFVATGTHGGIWTSPDGIAWTKAEARGLQPAVGAQGVCYPIRLIGSRLVTACGTGMAATTYLSDNGGATFTPTDPAGTWARLTIGTDIAVAEDLSGYVWTTRDGATWQQTGTRIIDGPSVAVGGTRLVVVQVTGTVGDPAARSTVSIKVWRTDLPR